MATTTCTLTLNSDMLSSPINISASSTITKAELTTGLELLEMGRGTIAESDGSKTAEFGLPTALGADKAAKLYIKNINTDSTEYFTVGLGKAGGSSKENFDVADSSERSVEIGRLYAGDFMIIPWAAASDENDIFVKPSVATSMVIEYMVFYE